MLNKVGYVPVLIASAWVIFVSCDSPPINTQYICENENQTISCPNNQTIQIVSAVYGRTMKFVCPSAGSSYKKVDCKSNTSSIIVSTKCNNKTSCTIIANNTYFQDPCDGVFKYIDVQYQCLPPPSTQYTAVACYNTTLTMSCPVTQIIQTVYANFGYRNSTVCPGVSNVVDNCFDPSSLQYVLKYCENKNSCSLTATSNYFGTACSGATPSYLETIYKCVPTAQQIPST